MWISREKYESAIALAKFEIQEAERKKLTNEISYLRQVNNEKQTIIDSAGKKIEELKTKVREQAKADMVYEAVQVILAAIKPETKKEDVQPNYDLMRQAMGMAQQAGISGLRQYGMYGSVGPLGNIFGL